MLAGIYFNCLHCDVCNENFCSLVESKLSLGEKFNYFCLECKMVKVYSRKNFTV